MPKTTRSGLASFAALGGVVEPPEPAPLARGARTILHDGSLEFGATGANPDVTLSRHSTATMGISGGLHVGAALDVAGNIGFYGTAAASKPEVTGARNAPEEALAHLLTALATLGLITDSTTAS